MKTSDAHCIRLIDRTYTVACKKEERESLRQAESYLNSQMKSIRAAGKVIGFERTLLMATLNITCKFLQTDSGKSELSRVTIVEND